MFLSDLTRRAIDYQVVHGATAIIPPYVHIDRPGSEWIDVQAAMWDYAREYLDNEAIALPVLAVMAVGWRMLRPVNGTRALGPMMRALTELAPREVALAASKVDDGAHPDERAMDLVLMVEQLRNDYSVVLWQQGRLGELGIAAGAQGYETESVGVNAATCEQLCRAGGKPNRVVHNLGGPYLSHHWVEASTGAALRRSVTIGTSGRV